MAQGVGVCRRGECVYVCAHHGLERRKNLAENSLEFPSDIIQLSFRKLTLTEIKTVHQQEKRLGAGVELFQV